MAEETSTAAATEISPLSEETPVPKEEPVANETPEEEEAKDSTTPEKEEEQQEPEAKEMDDHKRKLKDLEEKDADIDPVEKTEEIEAAVDGGTIADSKRRKVDGNDVGVDGIQEVQNTEPPVAGKDQLPLTEDIHPGSVEILQRTEVVSQQDPGSVEILQKSEVVSQQGILPSVGQEGPSSRKIEVPNNKVGVLIGKAGETIRNLQRNSGAQIQIARDAQADPSSSTRPVELVGTLEQISNAEKLIKDVIAEADAGGSPAFIAQGHGATSSGLEVHEMQVPNEKVGMIIGKGGETIRTLQTTTCAKIQLIPQHLPEGDVSKERTVRITGNRKQIESAKEMIKDVMNKVPVRPSPLSGGHSRGYRPHGPGPVQPQWGAHGRPPAQNQPQQTAGYDYQPRGTYPPRPTQYSQSYGGGHQQQLAPRSNPSAGWEQRPGAPVQIPSGGGYNNYYGQGGQAMSTQPSNPASAQNPSAVNYNYGNSQAAGYGQTNSYPQSVPSQQSYGPGYNEMRYDNQAPIQQVYGQQQPASTGFYHQQGSTAPQPGYAQQQPYNKSGPYSGGPPQSYGSAGPTLQPQPYDSTVPPMQPQPAPAYNQTYGPPSGAVDVYNQPPPAAGYSQPGSQVAPVYGQGGQPPYTQPGAQSGGYAQYQSTQPGYGEQPSSNTVNYGYQGGSADAGYGNVNPSTGYGATPATFSQPGYPQAGGYAQPAANPAGYDQQGATQYGYAS